MEKEFSCVGKDVFPRRKESLRSKGKDLRRVLKKRIGGRDTPAPYSLLSLLHWEVGGDSGGRVMEALVLLLGSWLGDEDETIRWDTSLEPLLELGLLGGRERFA